MRSITAFDWAKPIRQIGETIMIEELNVEYIYIYIQGWAKVGVQH